MLCYKMPSSIKQLNGNPVVRGASKTAGKVLFQHSNTLTKEN